jgi:catalase
MLQVPDQGDQIDDPSITWPETRKNAELGTIAITNATTESHATDKQIFLPERWFAGSRPAIR